MDNINEFLTSLINQAENSRLPAEHPSVIHANKKENGSGQKAAVPLTDLTVPSLLTRAKLSPITRRLEERRLAKIARKRALLKKGQKKSRGRNHWKRKALTKKKMNRRQYEASAGFNAILSTFGAKRIDKALWDKYITPLFREYTPQYLKVKLIKRAPGFGNKAYYGNKEFPMTVSSFRVHHDTLGVVWDGEEQRKLDGVPILRIEKEKGSPEAA